MPIKIDCFQSEILLINIICSWVKFDRNMLYACYEHLKCQLFNWHGNKKGISLFKNDHQYIPARTYSTCPLSSRLIVSPKTHFILSGNNSQTGEMSCSLVLVMDKFVNKFDCTNTLISIMSNYDVSIYNIYMDL